MIEEENPRARRTPDADDLLLWAREDEALRLYTYERLTFDAIAQRIGYVTKSGAWEAVQRALKRREKAGVDSAATLRARHNATLEKAMDKAHAMIDDDDKATDAFAAIVKLQSRQAALNGLDAPTVTVTETGDLSDASRAYLAAKVNTGTPTE